MKLAWIASLLTLTALVQELPAAAFLAQATDKTARDSRSRIHYGDSIEHHGTVTYLIVKGKRVQFTRDNVRGFAAGFDPSKDITNIGQIGVLRESRQQLVRFAQRFPTAKIRCVAEIRVIDNALARLAKGHYYMSQKWIEPAGETPAQPKKVPSPVDQKSFQVTLDGESYDASSIRISDRVQGIVGIVHSNGVKKYAARRLPEVYLKKLPIYKEEDKEFVRIARRHRGMEEEDVLKEIEDTESNLKAAAELQRANARAIQMDKIKKPIANIKLRTPASLGEAIISYKNYQKESTSRISPGDIVRILGAPEQIGESSRYVGDSKQLVFVYRYKGFWYDSDLKMKKDLSLYFDRESKKLVGLKDYLGEFRHWWAVEDGALRIMQSRRK